MESQSDIQARNTRRASAKLTSDLQKYSKQIKPFFENIENDTYSLKMLVLSFIEKIRTVLSKNNPIEVIEEFEKWIKFFTNEK